MRLLLPVVIGLLLSLATYSHAEEKIVQSKPPQPPENVPKLEDVKPVIFCGGCDQPFDTSIHSKVIEGLVSNKYVSELRRALYLQDTYHQFESKAHFDNCDFDGAITYIDTLLSEVNEHVLAAQIAKNKKEQEAFESSISKAFFALGQALHGVQDFYAHTNYVELSVDQVTRSTDIEVISPWRQSGKNRIQDLKSKGLVSGYVFWGFPQKCPNGNPSHGDMAKDKATTASGAVKVPHLQNRSRYQIAVQLAREASQLFIDDAFQRWPVLKEANGKHVAFEIIVDRRGL